MTDTAATSYRALWEDFARSKKGAYLDYKFLPTHRVGLSNFLREGVLIEYADAKPDDSLLDIGCASGRQVFALAKTVRYAAGVDIAQHFIDAATAFQTEHHISNTHFERAVIEKLPFKDHEFNTIICGEVIEHVFDLDVAFKEIFRVLKPGGTVVISVPHLNGDGTWWGRFLRMIGVRSFHPIEVFSTGELVKHGDAHVREFTLTGMRSFLEEKGLTIEAMTTTSMIDGPGCDVLMKVLLRIPPLRAMIIEAERFLSRRGLAGGRNIIVKATTRGS